MSFSQSAEGVTRFLRSKGTSTAEICDVSRKLLGNEYDFYFPQYQVFLMNLVVDRWNDSKCEEFRRDCGIWELWLLLWDKIETDDQRKKLVRNLKLGRLIQLSLEEMSGNDVELFRKLHEVVRRVNTCVPTAVSPEVSVKMLGMVINKTMLFELEKDEADRVLNEYLVLTDLVNVHEYGKKIPALYCSNLLLPSLKYFVWMGKEYDNGICGTLSNLLHRILFESQNNLLKVLSDFLNEIKLDLTIDLELELFKRCVSHFSKTNSKQLEGILKLIIDVDPQSCSFLLEVLHSSKKTISQEFLETLFNEAYTNKDLVILKRTMELDIEVGILNHERLFLLIDETADDKTLSIWTVLINCYVNAREFPTFLEIWETYSQINRSSKVFIQPSFTNVVAEKIPVLSKTQKQELMRKLLERIETSSDLIAIKVLQVLVIGLKNSSYEEASEFKTKLCEVFKITSLNDPEFWKLQYHVLELFEGVNLTTTIDDALLEKLLHLDLNDYSLDLYFAIFKFRELKEFETKPLTKNFMKFITNNVSASELPNAILKVFERWHTLVNLLFDQEDICVLVSILLDQPSELKLIQKVLKNEDFFEESNIVYEFVSCALKRSITAEVGSFLLQFPIQCINKTHRVMIIDRIVSKAVLSTDDIQLLIHLLRNPTFRSMLETDYNTLLSFVQNPIFDDTFENAVVELVWNNYLSQLSDKKCSGFVTFITEKLNSDINDEFRYSTFMLAHLVTKETKVSHPTVIALRESLIRNIGNSLGTLTDEKKLSWSMNLLFVQIKSSKHVDLIAKLPLKIHRTSADIEVRASYFLIYSLRYTDRIEYLLAQYLLLKELGSRNKMLADAVNAVIEKRISSGYEEFNSAFHAVVETLSELNWKNSSHVLELYQIFVRYLAKDNEHGRLLFVRSISNLLTYYCPNNVSSQETVHIILFFKTLLVTKPYLFSQYCMEMLFPLTAKIGIEAIGIDHPSEENFLTSDKEKIYVALTQLISSILLYHRYRLSDRHHLVVGIICTLLELLVQYKQDALSLDCGKSLSRLICNFCEPSNIKSDKKGSLSSVVSDIKRSLRKHVPILLLQIIRISLLYPSYSSLKKELRSSTDSIFNLLSEAELNLVNANLDNSGRLYFKTLYADYKKLGKWHED